MHTKWMDSLLKVELFRDIEAEELTRMLFCLNPQVNSYQKDELIVIEGDNFHGIGVVVKGEVIVTKENAAGNRVIMTKLGEGNVFGEMIAFSDIKYWAATVIAATDSVIYFIPPEKVLGNCSNICVGHSLLIENMLKIVSQRALALNKQVEYLSLKSIRAKASTYLLETHHRTGKLTFDIPLNRKELADFLNVSRTSLSREIANMRDEGLIDFYKSTFKILDLEGLKNSIGM